MKRRKANMGRHPAKAGPQAPLDWLHQAVILGGAGACGSCPISIPCWNGQGFSTLEPNFFLFECARCHAVGFILARDSHTLYVCTKLRNSRESSRIGRTAKERAEQHKNVERAMLDKQLQLPQAYGDIPYGCITRCRSRENDAWEVSTLPSTVDCRTTVAEGLPVTRY